MRNQPVSMPQELIGRTIHDSALREPIVRAMVLLYASRAIGAFDRVAAREVFLEGAAVITNLVLPAHVGDVVLNEAVCLGCAAAPLAASAFFRSIPRIPPEFAYRCSRGMVIRALAEAREIEAAISLVEEPDGGLDGADAVVAHAGNPGLRRRAMTAARDQCRQLCNHRDQRFCLPTHGEYYRLLSAHWGVLERHEAKALLDEAVRANRAHAKFQDKGRIRRPRHTAF